MRRGVQTHVAEDGGPEPDYNRVFCPRREAEVGLYVDPFEATSSDPKAHGTNICFLNELPDCLNEQFEKVPFDKIKGGFEKRGLLDGVIIEKLHKCNVYSCSFENVEALDTLWKEYGEDKLCAVISEVLGTDEIVKACGAEGCVLRTRVYIDEVDDCRKDLQAGKRVVCPFGDKKAGQESVCRTMIMKAREYQQGELAKELTKLRELFGKFEAQLGNFTLIIKQSLPTANMEIKTFQEFEDIYTKIHDKKTPAKCFDDMYKVRARLADFIREVQVGILHPLLLVHSFHETENQKKTKAEIKSSLQIGLDRLQPDFDHSKLRHLQWANKIVQKEHKLFLGLVSVLALEVETIINVDNWLDEYVSGFTTEKFHS